MQMRRELGLAADSPIVMSGHQAELWHPGIAAKLFALVAIAKARGAQAVWMVVDTDDGDVTALRVPTIAKSDAASKTSIKARIIRLSSARESTSLVPTGLRHAEKLRLHAGEEREAHPCVHAGLVRLRDVLAAQATNAASSSVAQRLTSVMQQTPGLAQAFAQVRIISTSDIVRTTAFSEFVASLQSSAGAAIIAAYNDATAMHPQARMRSLRVRGGASEVPLWWLAAGKPRETAWASSEHGELTMPPPIIQPSIQPALASEASTWSLAPRAIVTTLLMRSLASDLFIHGLGGGIYDRVLESWCSRVSQSVLSPSVFSQSLAPAIVVSGTLRLPLLDGAQSSDDAMEAIARAATQAHRAAHSPKLLGDDAAAQQKALFVQQIAAAKGAERKKIFRSMHALLERVRSEKSEQLARHVAEQETAKQRAAAVSVALDRTYSCVLHESAALEALQAAVQQRVQHHMQEESAGVA